MENLYFVLEIFDFYTLNHSTNLKSWDNIININARDISFEIANHLVLLSTQPPFTCSKLTIETLEQGVKYVPSQQ